MVDPGTELPVVLPGEDRALGAGLFVDLVPSSSPVADLRGCLEPAARSRLRRMVTGRAEQRCEVCGAARVGTGLAVHPRWTYDDAAGVQTLRRVICLCRDCHRSTHYERARTVGEERAALTHLCAVTGMTPAQAEEHVRVAFAVCEARSRRAWEVDLGLLTRAGMALSRPPVEDWVDLAGHASGVGIGREAGAGSDRSWWVGATGELPVGGLLGRLVEPSAWERLLGRSTGWRVLHSVPLRTARGERGGELDHLLVGPPGLVVINTKQHHGALVELDGDSLVVDGWSTDYIGTARLEAVRVRQQLTAVLAGTGEGELAGRLRVRPVLVLLGARLLVDRRADGVLVLLRRELLHTLRQLPAGLDADDRDTVFELARRDTTWVRR